MIKWLESRLNLTGILFLLIGGSAIFYELFKKDYYNILWFCYFALIILGIGILKRNSNLIKSQLNILAIPITIWTIDFLFVLITKNSLFGITNYFFIEGEILPKLIASQHLFTIPLVFYTLKKIKQKKDISKIFSIIQISIIFILTKLFSPIEKNINWIYHSTLNLNLNYYPLIWFTTLITLIFITNYSINYFLKK